VTSSVQFDPFIPELDQLILADAQTSGGLLFAVAPENSTALLNKLAQAGVSAKEIGHFTDLRTGTIQVHA
jgi:selenide,water dikinase